MKHTFEPLPEKSVHEGGRTVKVGVMTIKKQTPPKWVGFVSSLSFC